MDNFVDKETIARGAGVPQLLGRAMQLHGDGATRRTAAAAADGVLPPLRCLPRCRHPPLLLPAACRALLGPNSLLPVELADPVWAASAAKR